MSNVRELGLLRREPASFGGPILTRPFAGIFRVLEGLSPASTATLIDMGIAECADYLRELVGGEEAKFVQLTSLGELFGDEWREFGVGVTGIALPHGFKLPDPRPWPYYEFGPQHDRHIIQVWLRQATHLPTGVTAEVRWHPHRGETITFSGLPSSPRKADRTRAEELVEPGLKLIRTLDGRGRRKGSRLIATEAEFREAYDQALRSLQERWWRVTLQYLADEMGISKSTLCEYRKIWPKACRPLNQPVPRIIRT